MSDAGTTARMGAEAGSAAALDWRPPDTCGRCEESAAIVLFGATGDLAWRKVVPAVYSLTADGLLPCGLPIICVGRSLPTREQLLAQLREGVRRFARRQPLHEETWADMAAQIEYVRGDLDEERTYAELRTALERIDRERGCRLGRLFYCAVPPQRFGQLITGVKGQGLAGGEATGEGWARMVIEKPFGQDTESAAALERLVTGLFDEAQVYRMDHYLGKETVQNIAVLRFANGVFEPLWNAQHIDHVQITVAETVGLEGRGAFFDTIGILRDVVQNHVLEMLALVAMEPPVCMDADDLQDEKLKVLRSLHRMGPEEIETCTVRGRYGPGEIGGEAVVGYAEEPKVAPGSRTETYAALRLYVDNWRWAGVPFYVRAGKRLCSRSTEVVIAFKRVPHLVFAGQERNIEPNHLVLRIQPNEGLELSFAAKRPGPGLEIAPAALGFAYAHAFAAEPPEAYERLLLDAMRGDRTLFARGDLVAAAWEAVTPILEYWEAQPEPPVTYPAGSRGPQEADLLIAQTGGKWHDAV